MKPFILLLNTAFILGFAAIASAVEPGMVKTGQAPLTHDYTFTRSANAIRHKMEQKKPVLIVDVRNRPDYEKIHITSAINIPLYAVKTKPFFKRSTLVLTNNGFNYGLLEKEAGRLKEQGFNVSILRGGINAWLEKDFSLTGDVFARSDIWMVEPSDVYQESKYQSFLAINAAPGKNTGSLFQDAVALDPADETAIEILKKYNQEHPANNVLVFNDTGEGYTAIRKRLHEAGVRHVFFLKDGLDGFARYLHNLDLSRAPRDDRMMFTGKCKSCGD